MATSSSPPPGPCFLDTSVLMYAAGKDHPLREPCRAALRSAVQRGVPLITDAEVLQEILHRYFAIGRPDAAEVVYRSATDLCETILAVGERHTARALELLLEHPSLTARDAIHVATMEDHGLERILSTDRDFDTLPQVQRLDPGQIHSAESMRNRPEAVEELAGMQLPIGTPEETEEESEPEPDELLP